MALTKAVYSRGRSLVVRVLTVGLVAFIAAGCSMATSWVTTSALNKRDNSGPTSWTVTADAITGHGQRNVDLTANNLANLRVQSTIESGTAELRIVQTIDGKTVETVQALTDGFNDTMGLSSSLQPGSVTMRLNFDAARAVQIVITW